MICVESRQAYQALKSLATHKTDRDDARGLAHLARTRLDEITQMSLLWTAQGGIPHESENRALVL